jgi:serralysin
MPGKISLFLVVGVFSARAFGLDGSTALEVTPNNIPGTDWRFLELYTGGNNISSIADAGYVQRTHFDGIGAYRHDANTVRVLFNHEVTNAASISYLDLNRGNLMAWLNSASPVAPAPTVSRIGTAFTSIVGNSSLSRFCSSGMFEANQFGPGRGLSSRAYLTGEEVSGGSIYAVDMTPASPTYRTMFEVTAGPRGFWENVAVVDTGRSDRLGMLMFEDAGSNVTLGTAPMRLWIGNKRDVDGDGSMSFLEANGLAEGTTYYWVASGTGTSAPQRFTATGQSVAGSWSTSPAGAMLFTKLEDGHLSPVDPTIAAFNCQDQGVFTIDLDLSFSSGSLDTASSSATIDFLLEETNDGGGNTSFNSQDNLVWSTASKLFTQEDGSNQEIWQIDPSSASLTRDAISIGRVVGGAGESSGIVDISTLVGYRPGSVLLTNSLSSNLADNQMVVMFSPDAVVPEPACAVAAALILIALRRRASPSPVRP